MSRVAGIVATALLGISAVHAQQPRSSVEPIEARFHHVHLNSADPDAAIAFYASTFKAERQTFADGRDGVWTGESWVLFDKVNTPPPSDTISGLFHIGWGAEDMKAVYAKQVDSGTRFHTPLEDISGRAGFAENAGRFFFAYVDGPDHALIELNTANNHNFGHVHLLSADPVAAGEWYATHFGVRVSFQKDQRIYRGSQIAPSASFAFNHVRMLIWPAEYLASIKYRPFDGRAELAPSRGRVLDHLGFAVDDLDEAVSRMKASGVKVTSEPGPPGPIRFAFIEGPDHVTIELLEDHSPRPAKIPN